MLPFYYRRSSRTHWPQLIRSYMWEKTSAIFGWASYFAQNFTNFGRSIWSIPPSYGVTIHFCWYGSTIFLPVSSVFQSLNPPKNLTHDFPNYENIKCDEIMGFPMVFSYGFQVFRFRFSAGCELVGLLLGPTPHQNLHRHPLRRAMRWPGRWEPDGRAIHVRAESKMLIEWCFNGWTFFGTGT